MEKPALSADEQQSITNKVIPKAPEGKNGWPWSIEDLKGKQPGSPSDQWPRVTLVTPSYNQGRFLEATVRSVLLQDYPDLEYLVIDGGSEDESVQIIEKYESSLTFWESEPDAGQSHAINKGWRRATGKYLWWLNADDMLMPASLFTTVRFLEDHPHIDLVYGDLIAIDETDHQINRFNYPDFNLASFILKYRSISQPGTLLRKLAQESLGELDEELHFVMDREFWLRMALKGMTLAHIDKPVAYFRIHSQSKTQVGSDQAVKERYLCTTLSLKHPNTPASLLEKKKTVWANTHRVCARVYMKFGDYSAALNEVGAALRLQPIQILSTELLSTIILSFMGLLLGFKRVQAIRDRIRSYRKSL